MIGRILATALAAAALYAATLGGAAPAQDPTPTGSPEGTPAASSPAPTVSADPTVTAAPTQAPTETATATPDVAATTTASPTPFPSPVETTIATPSPTATDTPAASTTPGAQANTQAEDADAHARTGGRTRGGVNTQNGGTGDIRKCSASTSGSGCAIRRRHDDVHVDQRRLTPVPRLHNPNGSPAPSNPGFSFAVPGPARIGVPNFFIDKFRIPPFLLPIYQAAGMQYGVRWEVLAAINEIETDYGRNLNVSSAGALGWMQFMPATWQSYGVDANRDGEKDPYNPVDAIFAAARYLRAAGADQDLRRAVFAYNHADWYVDSVLVRAQVIGGLPSDLVGSLSGLTQGRFPVHAKATYAGELRRADRRRKVRHGANAAMVVESDGQRRGIEIYSRAGAPVIAVNDGRIRRIGKTRRLGRFVQLQDVYGNTYTYAHLKKVPKTYPAPKPRTVEREQVRRELHLPRRDAKPHHAASATRRPAPKHATRRLARKHAARLAAHPRPAARAGSAAAVAASKQRLFAHPERPRARAAGGEVQLGARTTTAVQSAPLGFDKRDFRPRPLKKGARVIGGTILGRIGRTSARKAPHLLFEIRPAGRGAPRIDPKPILDGWKLLESTAIYRAAGKNPFVGADADNPSIGQILLMSKEALSRRVLEDPRITIYGCGRGDIRSGQVDRRVLATLEFLAASGLKPTVSSLRCGHGYLTASGNVSEHSSGNAVDIAAVNGIPIVGHQGPGSITDLTIQRLLTLQGTMKPHQIISLMTFKGADNTFAMGDHADHVHVGWHPLYGTSRKAARQIDAVLKPRQWIKLIDRLGEITNPTVREQPSKFSVKVVKRASRAHRGE